MQAPSELEWHNDLPAIMDDTTNICEVSRIIQRLGPRAAGRKICIGRLRPEMQSGSAVVCAFQ